MGSREKLHKPQPDLGSTVIWLVSCKLQVAPDTREIRIPVLCTTKWMNDGAAGALCQASHASSVMDNYNWQLMWEGGQEQADASPENYPDHQHIPGAEHYPAINTHPEVRACHFSCHTSHYLNGVLSVSHSLLLQLLEGGLTVALMQLIGTMFCPTCSNWPYGSPECREWQQVTIIVGGHQYPAGGWRQVVGLSWFLFPFQWGQWTQIWQTIARLNEMMAKSSLHNNFCTFTNKE